MITFDGGRLTREQKAEIVREFTAAAHKVTGIGTEAFVVIIRENDHDNIGVGAELLSDRLKKP